MSLTDFSIRFTEPGQPGNLPKGQNPHSGDLALLQLVSQSGDLLESLPVIPALHDHRNYILSTWIKSYEATARKLCPFGLGFNVADYRKGESELAERVWPEAYVITSADDTFTVHGWVCGVPGKLYHVYVPPKLRNRGIAKGLVSLACGNTYSVHKPWPGNHIPYGHTVTWSPYP